MKNKLVLAALIAAGFVTGAQAQNITSPQVTVYLTGSTAFRAEVFNVLNGKIAAPSGVDLGAPKSYGTSSANQYGFQGTWAADGSPMASKTVQVYCSYTGSVDGQGALLGITSPVNYANVSFLAFTSGNAAFTHAAQLAFSDVTQDSGRFSTALGFPALVGAVDATSGVTGVAVVPFVFARNNTAQGAKITNISDNQAQTLLTSGFAALSYLTGNPGDAASTCYISGRNYLSGTRTTVFADTLFGITTSGAQYHNSASYTVNNATQAATRGADVAGATKFTATAGIFTASQAGWSSGSDVRKDMNNTSSANAFVGYMGIGDSTSLTLPAQKLTYNGVAFSLDAVRNGSYTLWTYEQLFSVSGDTSAAVVTFQPALQSALETELSTSVLASTISAMTVNRSSDGAPVQPN